MNSLKYVLLIPCSLICLSAGHNVILVSKWKFEIPLTIEQEQIPGSTDWAGYPMYVNLSSLGSHFWTHVKSDGSDIRVFDSDKTTELPLHVIYIDDEGTSGIGTLFFKVTLDADTDKTVYIRYGNPNVSAYAPGDTYGQYAVWSSIRQGWSFAESSGNFLPLISSGVEWSRGASTTSGTIGKLEKNTLQNTSSGSAATSSSPLDFPSSGTFCIWTRYDAYNGTNDASTGGLARLFGVNSCCTARGFMFNHKQSAAADNQSQTYVRTTVNGHAYSTTNGMITSSDDDSWVFSCFVHNSGTATHYRNGSTISMSDNSHHSTTSSVTNGSLFFNTNSNTGAKDADISLWFTVALSADQITTIYNNQNAPNSFKTVGTPRSLWRPQVVN